MALGEVLKDLYRLAAYPGEADRLFVYVESTRLRTYMAGAARRYGLDLDADEVALRPADAARLPTTAAKIIGADLAAHHVVARRTSLIDIDAGLRLAVYQVDPLGARPDLIAGSVATAERAVPGVDSPTASPGYSRSDADPVSANIAATARAQVLERDGARREILEACSANGSLESNVDACLGKSRPKTSASAKQVSRSRVTTYPPADVRSLRGQAHARAADCQA
ncbi:hypothetical protein SAMN05192558_104219 [Actinokineospora alba]|uniref:Uncharacterized protein n=2 Tax=Actinokineospora alba TaxID=504798 RepID=A0A1H0LP61_9PSEU|nr:hypothetical protein SAMN05421871_10978 [Actinokineospora alba]SDO69801.1 hypothetical protein SAMN05192558_104219 [Actinokineospora alba]